MTKYLDKISIGQLIDRIKHVAVLKAEGTVENVSYINIYDSDEYSVVWRDDSETEVFNRELHLSNVELLKEKHEREEAERERHRKSMEEARDKNRKARYKKYLELKNEFENQ